MLKFYRCNTCGNLIEIIEASGVTPICCGQPMTYLRPNTSEGAGEKHLPVYEICPSANVSAEDISPLYRVTVRVGETEHPMTEEHLIQWIVIETDQGVYRRTLSPNQKPTAEFLLPAKEKLLAIYAYCNRHGLWLTQIR